MLATIPVTIQSDGAPLPTSESAGERGTVLSCTLECQGAFLYQGWTSISTLSVVNPGNEPVAAGIAVIDGNQNMIAQSRIRLDPNGLDELHLCKTLADGGVAPPAVGLVYLFLPTPDSAVYGWVKDAVGRFLAQAARPFMLRPSSIAKSERRMVPPSVNTAVGIQDQIPDSPPPSVLINGTADP